MWSHERLLALISLDSTLLQSTPYVPTYVVPVTININRNDLTLDWYSEELIKLDNLDRSYRNRRRVEFIF